MPHTASQAASSGRAEAATKQARGLHRSYDESRLILGHSAIPASLETLLRSKIRPRLTKIVSLGLGSLSSKDQSRRFKQLALLMAIAEHLRSTSKYPIELYAQDPTFTKKDDNFLESLGIRILRTPSGSDLGDARDVLDNETLVYSPFLTVEAYKLLLEEPFGLLFGDDFNALRLKWPKGSSEHKEVDQLVKAHVSKYQRRVVDTTGLWADEDRAFPMAMYSNLPMRRQKLIEEVTGAQGETGNLHDGQLAASEG